MLRHKILGLTLFLVVAAALTGAFLYGYYYGQPTNTQQQSSSSTTSGSDPLNVINDLEKKAQANPGDLSVAETLGNDYFDLASSLRNNGDTDQAKQYFAKAVQSYQKVLAKETTRVDVQTDLATALYYSDQTNLADAAYKKAIAINPNYLNARLNYGIFLMYVRNDMTGARQELMKAMDLQPDADTLDKIKGLLAQTGPQSSAPPATETPVYTRDIEPVIFQSCAAQCHGPGGIMAQAPLQTYSAVMKYVKPGDINSPLLQKIKEGHGTRLDSQTIDAIQRWILAGAPGPK